MLLGIPRGFFYYDYFGFIQRLFGDSDVELIWGTENNDEILHSGCRITVDEACLPVKLMAGQIDMLMKKCDKVLVPRMMKDIRGRWMCPKILGLPELVCTLVKNEKAMVTNPLYFNDEAGLKKALKKVCIETGMDRKLFEKNFADAYTYQKNIFDGKQNAHVEAAWEFIPQIPAEGEIILPNMSKVFLAGHCYSIYDKFANCNIMAKLDELCIEAVTEKEVSQPEKERAVNNLDLMKKPFWESLVRNLGSAMCLKAEVDGIVYLSSFSCGPDAFIIEMLRKYVPEIPIMIIKLDEHKGEAGLETRLEAFADLIMRRRAS